MKLPMIPIHYKPDYLVSKIDENYGDCVLVASLKDVVSNVPKNVEPCFAVNIRKLLGSFFIETGRPFYGIRDGEYIKSTRGYYYGE